MSDRKEIDEVTGAETTGHVWDGDIRELNKPLPKWWLYTFYVCVLWSIGYWVIYPAWPTSDGYTKGVLGYSQRQVVSDDVAEAKRLQSKYVSEISATPIDVVSARSEIFEFALAGGKAAFGDNCAACHGVGAQGSKGYPNLNDDDWLWGGKLADIERTIKLGIRSGVPDARENAMPRFGIDKLLDEKQIDETAEFVLSLSGNPHDKDAAGRGKTVFVEQCAACHQENGKGNQELGSPNLTDGIWLYGGRKDEIVQSIRTGRGGVMPSWSGRLNEATIKMLTLYVHSLGGVR